MSEQRGREFLHWEFDDCRSSADVGGMVVKLFGSDPDAAWLVLIVA